MINVTKTYLPPLEEYNAYLKGIWERGHLTNNGPLVLELEKLLKQFLGVKHLFFVNNGTIALQIAIKALGLKGEIITTPFSYVATTSSIAWENCIPRFVDINKRTLCIDADLIEKGINEKTSAVMATHVYGNACHLEKIQKLADQYKLKIIYDAAHAFGVKYNNTSILNFGDVSTLSFHATKIFHTIEGGAIITNNDEIAHKISYMRNFGHNGQEDFWGMGINGKNCEFHAAMGLSVISKIPELIERRKFLSKLYNDSLSTSGLKRPELEKNVTFYNYAYYPVIFPSEASLLKVRDTLLANKISSRRYFYPSLNTLNYVTNEKMPVSEDISTRILCLPLYFDLKEEEVQLISKIILENL